MPQSLMAIVSDARLLFNTALLSCIVVHGVPWTFPPNPSGRITL